MAANIICTPRAAKESKVANSTCKDSPATFVLLPVDFSKI